jgi:hypothetical protein
MTHSRATQRGRLLDLLRSRAGQWIPLPEILALGFAQFGARILELRRSGHTILNRTEHQDGKVFSSYRLEPSPAISHAKLEHTKIQADSPTTFPHFGSLAPERYPD